jgi:histidinol-phosphate aminotransferase
MRTLSDLIRPNIKNLVPYSSARSEYKGDGKVFLDANENPFGSYNRYPDPLQKELKKEIAAIKNIDATQIFLGNGSDEVIDLCFRIFCSPGVDKALTFSPTYGMYDVSAAINDVALIKILLDSNFQPDLSQLEPYKDDSHIKLLILCSPNNPTGNLLNGIDEIMQVFNGIVLIDEAYIDFADAESFSLQLQKYPKLIVAQTLSKAFGMAAARIGMAFASAEIINLFNSVKPPYNISSINQQAAIEVLKNYQLLVEQKELLITERKRIASVLINEQLVKKVYPSDANFLLVEVADANKLYTILVNDGIICRNRHSLINNCIRITIGTPEENEKLLSTLRKQQITTL